MKDYSSRRKELAYKKPMAEVKPEKEWKVEDITADGYKVCHLYEDGRVLLSNKDGTKVIHKSDIK